MTARRYLPALLLLFVGSGCAALIYESRLVSVAAVDHRVVGGLPRRSARHVHGRHVPRQHPAAAVDRRLASSAARSTPTSNSASALIGILVLFGMPALTGIYTSIAGTGVIGILLRGLAAAICLLPPTLLMGATLPAMARWVKTTPEGVSWLGFFYGGNIAGAVLGSLLGRLLPAARARHAHRDLRGRGVERRSSRRSRSSSRARRRTKWPSNETGAVEQPKGAWAIYVAIGISGMTALSAEVIWTRILSLLYGGTVYTFSLILAVFLFGLGIGSSVGSALARNMRAAASGAGLGADAARGAPLPGRRTCSRSRCRTGRSIRRRRAARGSRSSSIWCARCGRCCRPRFSGAPASRSRSPRSPTAARIRRGSSAASTPPTPSARSSVRSAASLLLVVWLGSQSAQRLLIVLSVMASLLALDAASSEASETAPSRGRMRLGSTLLIVGAAMLAAWLARNVGAVPRHPRRLRPLRGEPHRPGGRHRHARRLERLDRRHPALQRRAQLPQRRQGAGLERAAGHAPAAHARAPDDADSAGSEARAGDRLRCGRHRRRRVDRAAARTGDDRRDRAARAGDGLAALRRAQLRRLQESEDATGPRRRAALPA